MLYEIRYLISTHRSLQDPYLFCSLSCKVGLTSKLNLLTDPLGVLPSLIYLTLLSLSQISHIVKLEGGISRHLYECEFLPLESCEGIDDAQMMPDSVLETQFQV